MPNSKQIVYLSQAQYAELIANGTITVDGVTVTYDENDIYVTPQAEPVTDVRINGTSISSNGIANIPLASQSSLGVVKQAGTGYSVSIQNDGTLKVVGADTNTIKIGNSNSSRPILPSTTHVAAFYGLTRAAGVDMVSSDNPVGTYTPEAKGAIQSMLGVSDLIATAENNLVASKAYKVGDVFTANGKLYKATAAIAQDAAIITDGASANCEETSVGEGFVKFTDYATASTAGIIKIDSPGSILEIDSNGVLKGRTATDTTIKLSTGTSQVLLPSQTHKITFYGLAKAAGDTTQSASNNAVGTYTDEAKSAIRTMLGAVGNEDYASDTNYGIMKIFSAGGLKITDNGLAIKKAELSDCKSGTNAYTPIVPAQQHNSVFYALATAAGDTTQKASSNAIGTYTDSAKASIKAMLGIQDGSTGTVDVTGATPTITAVENTRYVCGEVTSLSFTPPASGISIVRFTSGSTVTVLTIPSTVKFPEWFDPTSLETNTIYEICVTDGEFGAVMSWAL